MILATVVVNADVVLKVIVPEVDVRLMIAVDAKARFPKLSCATTDIAAEAIPAVIV